MIISASRRCDLPAYGLPSFFRSLEEGFREVRNPFNATMLRRVSLSPADVDCIVFWTRDPRALTAGLDRLGPFREKFFVHVTLTGYPRNLEPAVLETAAATEALRRLAEMIGPGHVAWRYDPLILADGLDREWHVANFRRLASELSGSASRVVLSLVDEYVATRGRLERAGAGRPQFGTPRGDALADAAKPGRAGPPEPWRGLLAELAEIAAAKDLRVQACAEPFDLAPLGIEAAPCVDGDELGRLFGFEPPVGRDKGQRPACSCAPSVDIGEYGRCPAGCVYCYARR